MKKILAYCLIFLLAQSIAADAVLASTFGTYRQEYEYGLFDGIKFNILNRKKDEKIIDIKDDVDKLKSIMLWAEWDTRRINFYGNEGSMKITWDFKSPVSCWQSLFILKMSEENQVK